LVLIKNNIFRTSDSSRKSGRLPTLVHRRSEEELSPGEFPDVLQEGVAVDDVLPQRLAQVVDRVLDGGLLGVRVQQLLEQWRRRRDRLQYVGSRY